MGLKITREITTKMGIVVPFLYIRIVPTLLECGKFIKIEAKEYADFDAFKAGHSFMPQTFFADRVFPYSAEIEGTDILQVASQNLKNEILAVFTDILENEIEIVN